MADNMPNLALAKARYAKYVANAVNTKGRVDTAEKMIGELYEQIMYLTTQLRRDAEELGQTKVRVAVSHRQYLAACDAHGVQPDQLGEEQQLTDANIII